MLTAYMAYRNGLTDALAFLSRISLPHSGAQTEHAPRMPDVPASVPWFPLAGAVLGLLAAALPLLARTLLPASSPVLAAWMYVCALAWLTRALHWDGLADLCDACGSNATGERFWDIMKDSRIGAFGVLGLIMGVGISGIAAFLCLEKGLWPALVLAPAFGRCMVVPLGRLTAPSARSSLAVLVFPGLRGRAAAFSCAATCLACMALAGTGATLLALVCAATALVPLRSLANRHGGCNGDFFGTAIIIGETALLLGAALAG